MAGSAVLLVNLGTPDAAEVPAVARYLREFLMDPHVIDMHVVPRWMLVNAMIVPFRAAKSTAAYQSIWSAEGSPLLAHTRALGEALARLTGLRVAVGMRYGNPSIAAAVAELGDADDIVVVPLYPQYAASSTRTAVEVVERVLAGRRYRIVEPFYADPGFLDAVADVARPRLEGADHVLFSFHSLPERHVLDSDAGCRLDDACCARIPPTCYRAHCLATVRGLVERLAPPAWSVSYQSRLGREKWLTPNTEAVLTKLGARGVKRLGVLVPSFTADCLETLEEIGIRGAETFKAAGGGELVRVDCVNSSPRWVEALGRLVGS